MANARDEIIRFIYEVTGDKDLAATAATMLKTAEAAEGGQEKVSGLAAELRKLQTAAQASEGLVGLKAALTETTEKLAKAEAGLKALDDEFGRTDGSSKKITKAFKDAEKAVADLTREQNLQRVAIQAATGTLDKAGAETANLARANVELRARASEVANELAREAKAAAASGAAKKQAGDETSALSGRLRNFLTTLTASIAGFVALQKIKQGLEEVLNAGERFDDLDKKFATAFGGLGEGAAALEKVRAVAKDTPFAFEAIADAAVKLKNQGFDPLDGTLQSLLDNTAATDKGMEDLAATIDVLGKANTKATLSIKAIAQLAEQGIPVFDLLAKATGSSASQIEQLAKNGQLGRESIKLLVAEIGRIRAGAAAGELGDLDAQIQKIKDNAQRFFDTVAKSGALDLFRSKLAELNADLEKAATDGRLKQFAQSLSDGIVAGTKAIGGAIGFIVDHASAIVLLAKAYAGFKVGSVLVDLAAMAVRMRAAALETIALSEATAATAGPLGRLGAGIKALPAQIKLGIAVIGIELVLSQLDRVITAYQELKDSEALQKDALEGLAQSNAVLAQKIADVKAAYQDAAKAQLLSLEQIGQLSQRASEQYLKQIEDAKKFYNALRVEAEKANDAAGLEAAQANLARLELHVDAVGKHLAALAVEAKTAGTAIGVAGQEALDVFDQLRTSGELTKVAVRGLFSGVDLTTVDGLRRAADIVQAVGTRGTEAGAAIRRELGGAIAKLSREDLELLRQSGAAAFKPGTAGAQLMEESIKRIGEAAAVAAQRTIDEFQATRAKLELQAGDLQQQIARLGKDSDPEFAKALRDRAKSTQVEIDALNREIDAEKEKLEACGNAGKQSFGYVREGANDAAEGVKNVGAATKDAEEVVVSVAENAAAAIASVEAYYARISKGALELFRNTFSLHAFSINSLSEFVRDLAAADKFTNDAIQGQNQEAERAVKLFQTLADTGEGAGRAVAGAFTGSEKSLRELAKSIDDGTSRFELLDKEHLDNLKATATAAADKIASIGKAAQDAKSQLENLADSLQDTLDRNNNNEQAIAKRKHDRDLAQIEELAKKGGAAATAEADRARKLLEENYKIELAQIEAKKKAQIKADNDVRANRNRPDGPDDGGGNGGGGGGVSPRSPQSTPAGGPTFHITLNGPLVGSGGMEELARKLDEQFKKLNNLRR